MVSNHVNHVYTRVQKINRRIRGAALCLLQLHFFAAKIIFHLICISATSAQLDQLTVSHITRKHMVAHILYADKIRRLQPKQFSTTHPFSGGNFAGVDHDQKLHQIVVHLPVACLRRNNCWYSHTFPKYKTRLSKYKVHCTKYQILLISKKNYCLSEDY